MSNSELSKYFKRKNLFTPIIVEYGRINENLFYEISKSRAGNTLFLNSYGVTFANKNGLLKDGRDKLLGSYTEALDYINTL